MCFSQFFTQRKLSHSGNWERDNPYNKKYNTALHLLWWHNAIHCHVKIPKDAQILGEMLFVFFIYLYLDNLVFP